MARDYPKVDEQLLERFNRAKRRSSKFQGEHENIRKFLRPFTQSFHKGGTVRVSKGERRTKAIVDGTGLWSLEQLASGLFSHLLDPSQRWFSLGVRGVPFTQLSLDMAKYLENASEVIFAYLALPESRFLQTAKEMLLDFCAYGTGVNLQEWNNKSKIVQFRAYPLAACHLDESASGLVDVVGREFPMTKRQIQQEFPDAILSDAMEKEKEDAEYIVTHLVNPVADDESGKKPRKPFVSTYFIETEKVLLRKGGYDRFPYRAPRWSTLAGDVYGNGPGTIAMPDLRLLDVMWRELIQAAQLANRPPMFIDEDGYMLPISYVPGSLIFKTPGTEPPSTVDAGSNFSITLELINQKREQIAKAFHVDWLLREKKKERQSVLEIQDDRTEMLQQLSSVVGRFESEFAGPTIRDMFYYLRRAGVIPEAPEKGLPLDVTYMSPASKAQLAGKAANIMQYLNDVSAYRAIDPTITDGIDTVGLGQELANLRDVPKRILLSKNQARNKQLRREQQEASALNAQNAQAMAGALKDTAQAQAAGLGQV